MCAITPLQKHTRCSDERIPLLAATSVNTTLHTVGLNCCPAARTALITVYFWHNIYCKSQDSHSCFTVLETHWSDLHPVIDDDDDDGGVVLLLYPVVTPANARLHRFWFHASPAHEVRLHSKTDDYNLHGWKTWFFPCVWEIITL